LRKNYLLKHVIEGQIDVRGRRGRRRKHLLNGLTEKRGYCILKEEAIDRILGELASENAMDLSTELIN
jgi:hypothetical protein